MINFLARRSLGQAQLIALVVVAILVTALPIALMQTITSKALAAAGIAPVTVSAHTSQSPLCDSLVSNAGSLKLVDAKYIHDGVVPIYVIGAAPRGLAGALRGGVLKAEVTVLSKLTKIPMRRGVVIVTRKLLQRELGVMAQLLKRGFVVITLSNGVKQQVDALLSRFGAISATFSETHIYLFKVISSEPIIGSRLPIYIKGYAGNKLTPEILADAISLLSLSFEGSWKIIGYVSWSSDNNWRPYGKLNIEHAVYLYENDPWSDMDLLGVRCTTEIISGAKLGWSDDQGYVYWNDYIESHYYLQYYTAIYDLRDYDPSSLSNVPFTISASLSYPPALVLSWTYSGSYICGISSESDLGSDIAGWIHDLCDYGGLSSATKETVKVEPGFVFTVSPTVTNKQRWVITGGWAGYFYPRPVKYVEKTVIIGVAIYYS